MVWTKVLHIILNFLVSQMFCEEVTRRCGSEYSIFGMMLRGHILKTMKTSISFDCLQACNNDVRCQSFNYVISRDMCELNDRTKEARPEDFVPNVDRYYYRRVRQRVPLGSIPELPAETCKEIKASEGSQAVSGKYWLHFSKIRKTARAHCDMETEDVDECAEDAHTCDVNSYCSNTVGSYICNSHRGLGTSTILGSPLKHDKYLGTLLSYLDPVLLSPSLSKFVRCYHAQTHGWATTTFHSNCDGKGPTVTIIKVNDYIFGGYTDVSWHSSCSYSSAPKAFIFSLNNINGYDPVKLAQYQYAHKAMYSCSSYGPTFGGNLGQHDLYIPNDALNNQNAFTYCGSTYSLPSGYSFGLCAFFAGSNKFSPTDIEVFYETTA